MSAFPVSRTFVRSAIAAAIIGAGLVAHPGQADARDRFSFSTGFDSRGGSSFGIGYSTGGRWGHRGWGHRDWGRRDWGHRRWGGDELLLGLAIAAPLAYLSSRYYDYPAAYPVAPYSYPARPYYSSPSLYSAGGVVVFPGYVRDRLSTRTRGAYYDAYRSALAAPIGESINWRDGRVAGDVMTTRDGWAGERYCREFRQNIVVDGKTEEAYGTACRNAVDTDWEIVPD